MPRKRGPAHPALTVSVFDIARKPGAHKRYARTVPAPAGLGTDVIGVPEDSDLELDASLESVTEGIWVSGTVEANAVGRCVRCLDDVTVPIVAEIQGLYAYPGSRPAGAEDEEDVYGFDGENIDLEAVIRDATVGEMPFAPLCDPACPGLCDRCGARLRDEPDHRHDEVDPRWAALEGLNEQKEK